MQRIKKRRHGLGGDSIYSIGANYLIKIGFDARKKDEPHPKPGKLPGFVVLREGLEGGILRVDMDVMKRLGDFTIEKIKEARAKQLKSPPDLLPTVLHFRIFNNAQWSPDGWLYPGTFSESYECWQKVGKFCEGDGLIAKRRQDDGSKKEIACVPIGREGADPKTFCEFSVNKKCKSHSRLILGIFVPQEDGSPLPASPIYGHDARFRFDTSSEYNPIRILAELDRAADRVQGRLADLTGTLTMITAKVRTGQKDVSVGIAQQIQFQINEAYIRRREELLRSHMLEEARLQIAAPPEQEIDIPEKDVPPTEPIDDDPGDDVDFGGEMEPASLDLETATNEDIGAALLEFAEQYAEAKNISLEKAFKQITYTETNDDIFAVSSLNWFFQGGEKRLEKLREIAKRVLAPDVETGSYDKGEGF